MSASNITIIDDLSPEDMAMLQALQSRSPASVAERLEKVHESGSGKFMDRYYVGYGHKSIGDCGTTTIFVEGVTMLTAKALQDWPLYNGQEASTRYMDFSESEFFNPLQTPDGEAIQERWRKFYLAAQEPVRQHLRKKYPRQDDEDEAVYERAINARSFDILRSFLPAGAMTNLSWQTNLRQALDKLAWTRLHPDEFIANVSEVIFSGLKMKYPHSFRDDRKERSEFRRKALRKDYFVRPEGFKEYVSLWSDFQEDDIEPETMELLKERPPGAEIPWYLLDLGLAHSSFALDFGSYRDLQRHRAGIIRMPILTTKLGFNKWYLEELPEDIRLQALRLLEEQDQALGRLDNNDLEDEILIQNYIAMGYQVPCLVNQGLPGLVYRLELRSGKTVHPTLRQVVHEEIRQFKEIYPNIPLHVDMDPDSWTVRRGTQTITERKARAEGQVKELAKDYGGKG